MRVLKALLPLVIIGVSLFIAKNIMDNPPATKPRPDRADRPIVIDTQTAEQVNYQVLIDSYGTVQPATETSLTPQVAGKIIAVSDSFNNGGFINEGEVIVQIDQADYKIQVKTAAASLAQAKATLSEQSALSEQAINDWKRLGRKGNPSPLVARKPQLDAARAQVSSAQAQLEKARLDLNRTSITAPFDGRIRNKNVDFGQYVSPGTQLTEIFSTQSAELKLPVAMSDLPFIDVPSPTDTLGSKVTFKVGKRELTGKILRSDGSLDSRTRQLYVTALIESPFKQGAEVIIGQFLRATIKGRLMQNVVVVPTALIDANNQILLTEGSKVRRQKVNVVWRDERTSLVDSGLRTGDQIVLTPLGDNISMITVRVAGAKGGDTPARDTTQIDNKLRKKGKAKKQSENKS